jgi:CRP-like cAMP-binding protein
MTTLSIAQREPDGEERNRQMAGGLVTLSSFMGSLKNAEKRVAEYVLANSNEVMYLSITDLAEKSGTSEATVSRLCGDVRHPGEEAAGRGRKRGG